MEHEIKNGINSIRFLLYPSLNLVAHNANLMGILDGTGSQKYQQRQNPDAISAIGHYKKPNSDQFLFSTFLVALNRIDDVERAIPFLKAAYYEYFNDIDFPGTLQRSWEGFYRGYWKDNHERLERCTEKMILNRDWNETLHQMELSTDSEMISDLYVVGVEATANSAFAIHPNICIGTPRERGDCGFVHEGLHLLIALASDKYKPAIDFMNSHEWTEEHSKKFPYRNWRGKIEQAVVISLDSLISGRPEYLEGCIVGDLRETVYDEVKGWFEDGRKIPLHQFLMQVLRKNEKEMFI